MKILILGASGVIGQHMRLCVPEGVEPIWCRRAGDALHVGIDLAFESFALTEFLQRERPRAIVNLAGESRPDVVEKDPERFHGINVLLPGILSRWCQRNNAHYVHVSTQAVFSGERPPYHAKCDRLPVNEYGRQKLEAEQRVEQVGSGWTIARPTFVLGVRPMPAIGRENPIEQMLGGQKKQVEDRWFSPSLARDVAVELWEISMGEPLLSAVNLGIPMRVSRHTIAYMARSLAAPVSHDDFPFLAPRPVDTTYAEGGRFEVNGTVPLNDGIEECKSEYESRRTLSLKQRARELSIFTGTRATACAEKLSQGFIPLHHAVTEDFRDSAPKNDEELLEWYRTTEAYIWELSAYHLDPGFNYMGMCRGIAESLKARRAKTVLCLGDGIGDLTLTLHRAGFEAVYHDLFDSRTAKFASARFLMYEKEPFLYDMTSDWRPVLTGEYDAIVSFDFLEHVTDVPAWTAAIRKALKPGGLFFAQNAFACGSGPDGAIPMHLARNDRFEKDWDPMLSEMGFDQLSSNWYRRAA